MIHNYEMELKDLGDFYGATITSLEAEYDDILEGLIYKMEEFVQFHKTRKTYRKKIKLLCTKLKAEEKENDPDDQRDRCDVCYAAGDCG